MVGAIVGTRAEIVGDSAQPVDHPRLDTPRELVNAPQAVLVAYDVGARVEVGVWTTCTDGECPLTATWSDDGWATASVLPMFGDSTWSVVDDAFVAVNPHGGFVVDPAGNRHALRIADRPGPMRAGDVYVTDRYQAGPARDLVVDPSTGAAHPIEAPPDVTLYAASGVGPQDVIGVGFTASGRQTLVRTTDGGLSWTHRPVPLHTSGSLAANASNAAVLQRDASAEPLDPPVRLAVSTAAGGWTTLAGDDVPFGVPRCMAASSGALVFEAGRQVWVSDASWRRFEAVPDAPDLDCVFASADSSVVTGINGSLAYVSTDGARTWTRVDPR
jgi:hypothetical protein